MKDDEMKPHHKRAEQTSGAKKEAWKQTLEDMEDIAADRREDGWEVTTVRAHHTDPVTREMNDHDRFGLFHILPKSDYTEFTAVWDEKAFTEFLVYGATINGSRFGVTEYLDPENKRSILLAHQYDTHRVRGLAENAADDGALYTYMQKIDGTVLGSFRHEEYEPLLPQPDDRAENGE